MSVYRQAYEDWFSSLSEEERRAETSRVNTSKTKVSKANALNKGKVAPAAPTGHIVSLGPQTTIAPQTVSFTMTQPQQQSQQMMTIPQQIIVQAAPPPVVRDANQLLQNVLQREPVEPARSPKQLFISEWLLRHKKKKPQDAQEAWKALTREEKKQWAEKLEPQRQKYIEAYTVFVRGLDKEELELYTDLKEKRDEEEEARRRNESSDSDVSETSASESESESDTDSD